MRRVLLLVAAALLALSALCCGDDPLDLLGDDCVVASNCRGGDHPNGCVCNSKKGEEWDCDLPGTKDADNCCYDRFDGC